MAGVVTGRSRRVEGKFPCPYCGGEVTSGLKTCPHCGGTYETADALKAKPTNVAVTGDRLSESKSRQISCQSCNTRTNEVQAKANGWRCTNCGSMVEPGHDEEFIPTARPEPSPRSSFSSDPGHQYKSEPHKTNLLPYILGGAGLLVVIIFLVVLISNHMKKLDERTTASATVVTHVWQTSVETLKPYSRNGESDHPVSGDGITPYPMVTKQVDTIPNIVSTEVNTTYELVPPKSHTDQTATAPKQKPLQPSIMMVQLIFLSAPTPHMSQDQPKSQLRS